MYIYDNRRIYSNDMTMSNVDRSHIQVKVWKRRYGARIATITAVRNIIYYKQRKVTGKKKIRAKTNSIQVKFMMLAYYLP